MSDYLVQQAAEINGEGYMEYDNITRAVEYQIPFRGKTLHKWAKEIEFPLLEEGMSIYQLEEFNRVFVSISGVIMSNLAMARANMEYVKNSMELAILREKSRMEREIADWNSVSTNSPKRKLPAKDVLNDRAMFRHSHSISAYSIGQLFYEFWKSHYEKLKLIGDRLTGMNIIKNVESRISH